MQPGSGRGGSGGEDLRRARPWLPAAQCLAASPSCLFSANGHEMHEAERSGSTAQQVVARRVACRAQKSEVGYMNQGGATAL